MRLLDLGAAFILRPVKSELHGVWKTLADAVGKKVDVSGKKVEVTYTFAAIPDASDDVRYRRVLVTCTVVNASVTRRNASERHNNGV